MKKKKVYVLMISKTFPATHPRRGEPTYFKARILANNGRMLKDPRQLPSEGLVDLFDNPKRHTIRGNYELWKKRAEKINAGEAVLSLRQWSGSPYNFARDGSKQVEIMQLEKIGVESIKITNWKSPEWEREKRMWKTCIVNKVVPVTPARIAKNDGLSLDDFDGWFPNNFEGCIIHFTDFRYNG